MSTAHELTRRNRIGAIVCSVLFIANYIACYPGFLSSDSLDQYNQAVTGKYHDWHPPLMAFVWRVLNIIYQGPQLMLAMQLGFLWLSACLLATTFKNKYWCLFGILWPLAPFVLNFSGNIFKDSQMALSWLLAFSLLFRAIVHNKKLKEWQLLACALLIFYGAWIRYNALPGSFPLLFLLSYVWVTGIRKRVATFLVLVLIVFAGVLTFKTRTFNVVKTFPEGKLYMHDLAGIFVKTGEDVFPRRLYTNPGIDTAYLRMKYIPATFDDIWWNADSKSFAPQPNALVIGELREAWIKAIKSHPDVYFSNRYNGFLDFLRLHKRTDGFIYSSPSIEQNPYNYKPLGRGFHQVLTRSIDLHGDMPYMQPWFWLVLNILLLFVLPWIPKSPIKLCGSMLALSSFLYLTPQFFVYQIDTDFRYVYWNCISCTLAAAILVMGIRNVRSPKVPYHNE